MWRDGEREAVRKVDVVPEMGAAEGDGKNVKGAKVEDRRKCERAGARWRSGAGA